MIKFTGSDECTYEGHPPEQQTLSVDEFKHRIKLSSTWQGFLLTRTDFMLGVMVKGIRVKATTHYTKKQIEDAINKVVLNNVVQYLEVGE